MIREAYAYQTQVRPSIMKAIIGRPALANIANKAANLPKKSGSGGSPARPNRSISLSLRPLCVSPGLPAIRTASGSRLRAYVTTQKRRLVGSVRAPQTCMLGLTTSCRRGR